MGRICYSEREKITFLTGSNGPIVGRTRGVEAKHPIARNLQSGAADPRSARARAAFT
jgi:hypothetical protein